MFALKVALIASALLQLAVGQTLDVRLYRSDNCLIGTGMACHGVQSNQCCQDPNDNRPFSSARTENWNGIGPGTALKLYATQGGVKCALVLTRLTEAMNCLGNDWDEMITGAAFRNGVGAGEDTGCAAVHPADEYFYQPGDGYRYTVNARNSTNAKFFSLFAKSQKAVEGYILDNYERKVALDAAGNEIHEKLSDGELALRDICRKYF